MIYPIIITVWWIYVYNFSRDVKLMTARVTLYLITL